MAVNGYNTGKDVTWQCAMPTGMLTIPGLTEFEAKPRYHEVEHDGIDGENDYLPIPAGWDIEFELDRVDNTADSFIARGEALYYAGQPVQPGTITETITNVDGSVSQYQFVGVVLTLKEGGKWRSKDKVVMRFSGRASKRNALS